MRYDYTNVPEGTPVWAYAYCPYPESLRKGLYCLPERGEVDSYRRVFFPYKKGSTTKRKSGRVSVYSRQYADTYAEAVDGFNELVDKRVSEVRKIADEFEKEKIFIL